MAIDLLKLLSAIVYINTGFESICACDASNDNYQTEHWDSDTLILNKIKGKSESNMQYSRTGNLKQINSSWFPNTTEVISFNNNLLIKLNNFTFSHLVKLKVLNISNNKISVIEPLSFEGLTNLRILNLRNNEIQFNLLSVDVFKPLIILEHLDLVQQISSQKNDVQGSMLQPLTFLRNLSISTVSFILDFEPEFLSLTNLEVLEITGLTRNITNTSFENVKGLKELALRDMM
ncbi:relaxin receptor 1 [Biomphalaria glabrata]